MDEVEATVFVWYDGKQYIALEPTTGSTAYGKSLDEVLKNVKKVLEEHAESYDIQPVQTVVVTKVVIHKKT